ncbi:MAG: glycosyltransferase family 4 protein [Caldilineales bacterium]|nr:glycosyltransferase family 4 protein [Caldilineales bacterium]
MRVCYLADPTSTHTVKWLAYFVRCGHEVHLMGWNPPRDAALAGVHYHHLPDELEQPFPALVRSALWHLRLWPIVHGRQMDLLLRRIQPDIFDILMLNADQIPAALAWPGPLVVTPWGSDLLVYPKHYRPLTRFFLRRALRRADMVLCNSGQLVQAALRLGAQPGRIRRVGQIVDLARFCPGLDGSTLANRLGLTGWPLLLSPRQLQPNYRIEVLIRALAEVLPVFPQAQLVLLGKRDLDPAYVAGLDALIGRLGVQEHVNFAGWFDYREMPLLYALADVVLSVPVSDSRPSSVFEAMACGVPAVVSDLDALREVVREGDTGLLTPGDDPQAVAAAILRLLGDDPLRQRIVAQALDFVRCEGDYETQMARVAGYYDELLRN